MPEENNKKTSVLNLADVHYQISLAMGLGNLDEVMFF
jgi:hypothetical protein